ncbi:hypothetical protein CDD81_7808 [Ophiocordyceps australis]|uniref:F-box domain-containing protein n=1 Tax=Ophiocordyceps australis TaxID=1399860 RepID=A0A2C5Y9N8_9HYPO|nr:hypothetical protein CDD81_7808 [Ophiocordyceps australis]
MPKRNPKASIIRIAPRTSRSRTLESISNAPVLSPPDSEIDLEANTLSIASLTSDTPLLPLTRLRKKPITSPFPFLSLPSELRLKIYAYYFGGTDAVLDLGPFNYKRVHKLLGLMRVCKQIHSEATHFFYSTRIFRLFPVFPGRYFKSKKPLLARLHSTQRACMTVLELRLGPGWNAPPRGWTVNDMLGLKDCIAVHKLRVFVECDPSDSSFKGFRRAEGFYEGFCRALLGDVIQGLPHLRTVEFDAWPSVNISGAMMGGLVDLVLQLKHQIKWGPERGWRHDEAAIALADPLAANVAQDLAGY